MDYRIADALNDLSGHSRFLDDVMVFAARDLVFVVFALAALLMVPALRQHAWGALSKVAATLLLAFVFGLVAAQLYAEPRPFTSHSDIHTLITHAPGQSFPSDHATAAFAVAFAVLAFVSQRWGWLLVAAAVLIGTARVYVGVHYPGDILGSFAVALLAVGVVQVTSVAVARRRRDPDILTA